MGFDVHCDRFTHDLCELGTYVTPVLGLIYSIKYCVYMLSEILSLF